MFDQSFSFILTIAALVVGFMLFTGHGSIFMKGGNTQARNQKYDEKKMESPFPKSQLKRCPLPNSTGLTHSPQV